MKKEQNITTVWEEYQKGVDYNYQQQLYEKSKRNYNFYLGNQWEGAKLSGIQPITLNIIKSIVKYKVGVVKTNTYQIYFNSEICESQEDRQKVEDICNMLNRYANRLWEKNSLNKTVRNCINDACIDNEGIVYFYADPNPNSNNIFCEQVNRTNIYYGNENDDDIQSQPYIIISFRRTVEEVKQEARENGISEKEIDLIVEDQDIEEQAGRDKRINELSSMCLVLLKLYKKDGKVWAKKCTKLATVMRDSCLDIDLYPVAHVLWERVKGSSRGQGEVEWLIPNQIEINKTATRRALAVKMVAFPKLVANTKYISNTKALSKVGTTIEVNEFNADDVNKVVNYLKPTAISADAYNLQRELQEETQNLAGASDTATGNVDPTKAAGKAILAVQQASQQPINEQIEAYKDFIEDIAKIWFEMLKANSVNGLVLTREQKDYANNTTLEEMYVISYKELQKYDFDIRIDITPNSPFDKYAIEQSLGNLLTAGHITFEEYVKALPEDSAMPKSKLKDILKDREEKENIFNQIEKTANALDSAMQQAMTEQEMNNVEQTGVNPKELNMINQEQVPVNQVQK
ncbi:MAG: hypothetical protein HFJ34_05265 [Clostridia bacterium]|nr:hypothetical protein [Clostridia bacterium]